MKRPIPALPAGDESLLRVLRALKENQEETMGMRGGMIAPLPEMASLQDVIAKLNEVIAKLQ